MLLLLLLLLSALFLPFCWRRRRRRYGPAFQWTSKVVPLYFGQRFNKQVRSSPCILGRMWIQDCQKRPPQGTLLNTRLHSGHLVHEQVRSSPPIASSTKKCVQTSSPFSVGHQWKTNEKSMKNHWKSMKINENQPKSACKHLVRLMLAINETPMKNQWKTNENQWK